VLWLLGPLRDWLHLAGRGDSFEFFPFTKNILVGMLNFPIVYDGLEIKDAKICSQLTKYGYLQKYIYFSGLSSLQEKKLFRDQFLTIK